MLLDNQWKHSYLEPLQLSLGGSIEQRGWEIMTTDNGDPCALLWHQVWTFAACRLNSIPVFAQNVSSHMCGITAISFPLWSRFGCAQLEHYGRDAGSDDHSTVIHSVAYCVRPGRLFDRVDGSRT
jgi:hypothetical protein